jgi:hypothetical protein
MTIVGPGHNPARPAALHSAARPASICPVPQGDAMNFRLPLVAALALLAGACSHQDQASSAAAAAGAASSRSGMMSTAAAARLTVAQDYRHRFASAPNHGSLVAYPQAAVVRADGAYTSYLASISEAHARDAIGGVLTVPLPTGEQLRFRYERHIEHPNGDWTWIGSASGAKGQQAIITFGAKAAFGTIGQAGQQPWRLTVQNGASWLIRTDAAQLATINNSATRPTSPDYIVPPGQVAGATHRSASSGAMTTASAPATAAAGTSASNTVDLVIGYTPGFVSYYGGDSQAQTRLNNMVDITNEAYVNSGVDARVRLVKTLQVSYADNTSNDSALEALTGFKAPSTQTTPDAAFSALRAARDQYGADLVSLVRRFQDPENDGCGIAWLIGGGQSPIDNTDDFFGYSVVSDGRDAGTDGKTYYCREETLAHELGHNMGAQHDRVTAQGSDGSLSSDEYGRYAYSFGYKTTSTTGNFYTIMAYGDSGQTTYRIFSNPRSTFCGGLACGVDNQADNARTLTQTIPAVATFRSTVVSASDPPAYASLFDAKRTDINGDGRSDLLWRLNAQTAWAYWTMDGGTKTGGVGYTVGSTWSVVATGDFNADGRLDVIWSDGASMQMWKGGSSGFSGAAMQGYPTGWKVVSVGDFNGDGTSDLLWRDNTATYAATWLMQGPTVAGSASYAVPSAWSVVGSGDLTGDGRSDIIWSNGSSMQAWSGTGAGFAGLAMSDYPAGWTLFGIGDFDGDGKVDLFWREPTSGQVAIWKMSSGTRVNGYGFTASAAWSPIQVADFTGDGRADIAWSDGSSMQLWYSLGTSFAGLAMPGYPTGWFLIRR